MCDDDGFATVLAAALVAVLVAVGIGGAAVGVAVAARHRAQSAADLAALAAAYRVGLGAEAACRRAESIAGAGGATVTACVVEALDVVVTVNVAARWGDWSLGTAVAAARAGPVEAV